MTLNSTWIRLGLGIWLGLKIGSVLVYEEICTQLKSYVCLGGLPQGKMAHPYSCFKNVWIINMDLAHIYIYTYYLIFFCVLSFKFSSLILISIFCTSVLSTQYIPFHCFFYSSYFRCINQICALTPN